MQWYVLGFPITAALGTATHVAVESVGIQVQDIISYVSLLVKGTPKQKLTCE